MKDFWVFARSTAVRATVTGAILGLPLVWGPSQVLAQDLPNVRPLTGPVTLRQKWVTGQQLSYDVSLNGTMSTQQSKRTGSPIAGIPLDIDIQMQNEARLDTLEVDPQGTGTVALHIPQMQLKAQALMMNFNLALRDGLATMSLNGKPMGNARGIDARAITDPSYALKISDRGRVQSAVLLPGAPTKTPDVQSRMLFPIDPKALSESVIWRVFPNVWPTTEIHAGDKWTTDVTWPLANTTTTTTPAPTEGESLPIGKLNFTTLGEETIAGHKTVRVGVEGSFVVDAIKADAIQVSITSDKAPPADAVPAPDAPPANPTSPARPRVGQRLTNAQQKVDGNIWFDADAGQIVRAELELQAQATASDVLPEGAPKPAPKAKPNEPDSWMDFSGTLQVQLKQVQQRTAAVPEANNG